MSKHRRKQKQQRVLRWAAALPVREKGGTVVTLHPLTTLAADAGEAEELAREAGLVFLGGPLERSGP